MMTNKAKETAKKKGYCNWCDTLTNRIIKEYDDDDRLIWVGCVDCYNKKKELEKT